MEFTSEDVQPEEIDEQTTEVKKDLQFYLKNYLFLIGVAVAIILLDQWTKGLVEANLKIGETWMPWEWLAPYARIVHWWNTGAAFGMFQQFGEFFKYLNVLVAALIAWYFPQVPDEEWYLKLAMAMQLGGAMGNFIDRMTIGHVTDFISVGNFAVFNVADSAITGGVIVLVLGVIWTEYQARQLNMEVSPEAETAETQLEPDPIEDRE